MKFSCSIVALSTALLIFDFEILKTRLREQAFLNAGIHIQISDERDPDNIICENFCYEGGISSFVEYLNKKKAVELVHPDIIHFSTVADDDQATAEVAMQYNDSYNYY